MSLTKNIILVTELELKTQSYPSCIAPYYYDHSYMMVEINTGSHKGSIKIISKSYNNIHDLIYNFNYNQSSYPLLQNYLILGS